MPLAKTLHLRAARSAVALALPALSAVAWAQSRGELLYTAHCVACHTSQIHWRDHRRASDWDRLQAQVRQWQATAHLGWSDEDIAAVTRHLNDTIYHYPAPSGLLGSARPRLVEDQALWALAKAR